MNKTADIKASAHADGVEEVQPNRMQRRRQVTRARLLSATLKLVIKKGIDKTTMDDISEAADLGRRTLYNYFSSKDECILAAVAETYRGHAIGFGEKMSATQDAALTVGTATQAMVAALLREPVTARLVDHPKLLAAAISQGVIESAFRDIQTGIDQQRFTPPTNEKVLHNMMIWALTGLVIYLIENDIDVKDQLRDYAAMYLMTLGIGFEEAKQVTLKGSKTIAWAA